MTDPWADVRTEEFAIWLADGPDNAEIQEKVAVLLADADALLTATGALTDIAEGQASIPNEVLMEGRAAVTSFMWTYSQMRARKALATLPEHLK